MKGLIRKDLYFLENSLKMLIIAMIVIGIGVSFLISSEIFIIIFPIVLGSVILITIPKEKNNKWDKFIAMTPLSKDTLLNSKYILYLSMTILGLIIGIAVTFLSYIFTKKVNFMDMYSSIGLTCRRYINSYKFFLERRKGYNWSNIFVFIDCHVFSSNTIWNKFFYSS